MRNTMIDSVLFDFDATLTKPGAIDFADIKKDLGCPHNMMILDYVDTLNSESERDHAVQTLRKHERLAADASVPADAAEWLVHELRSRGYRVGILTRNSTESVVRALHNFPRLAPSDFNVIVSRDDPAPIKPHADSVRYAATAMGAIPERLMMVGDYRHDIDAGNRAGSWTCLIDHGTQPDWIDEVAPDYRITTLDEIPGILNMHRRPQHGTHDFL